MQRGAGLFEYVEGHIYLRQTFAAAGRGGIRLALPESSDSAQLRFQRSFKRAENQILEVIVQGGLLSMWLKSNMPYACRSVNKNNY